MKNRDVVKRDADVHPIQTENAGKGKDVSAANDTESYGDVPQSPPPRMQLDFSDFLNCSPIPTFVIDMSHTIRQWNRACEHVLGFPADLMVSTQKQWMPFYRYKRLVLADLIIDGEIAEDVEGLYGNTLIPSTLIAGAYESEAYFESLGESGLWIHFTAAPLHNPQGAKIGAIEILEDITERKEAEKALRMAHNNLELLVKKRTVQLAEANRKLEFDILERQSIEAELLRRNHELTELNLKLSQTREQLVQSEKLASIGQLAAGVAHEINNPIGYIFSNFSTLENYIQSLFDMIAAYEKAEAHLPPTEILAAVQSTKENIELEYLKEDIPLLMRESKEGVERVRKIVQDLKDFSHVDSEQEWQWVNLHRGIDSTLNVVNNEIKYKADIVKEYGDLPEVQCLSSQINQVIMNLVVNAAHALGDTRGQIVLRTRRENEHVVIEVEDNGSGIPKDIVGRIFDPFFTTKPLGKGTGLGLSLSYGIIKKHQGEIEVESEVGKGSRFRIRLPIKHAALDTGLLEQTP